MKSEKFYKEQMERLKKKQALLKLKADHDKLKNEVEPGIIHRIQKLIGREE